MTEFGRLSVAPTKAQHDAVVAKRGRSFTDQHMREARNHDDDGASYVFDTENEMFACFAELAHAGYNVPGGLLADVPNPQTSADQRQGDA